MTRITSEGDEGTIGGYAPGIMRVGYTPKGDILYTSIFVASRHLTLLGMGQWPTFMKAAGPAFGISYSSGDGGSLGPPVTTSNPAVDHGAQFDMALNADHSL